MKYRRALSILLLAVVLIYSASCKKAEEDSAGTPTTTSPLPAGDVVSTVSDGVYLYNIYETYAEIAAYYGGGAIMTVPETYEGITVRSIGDGAFSGNEILTDVILPDSVVYVKNKAFANCKSLANIKMDGVLAIGMHCFENTAFTEAALPSGLCNLGKYAFYGSAVTSAVIPDSLVAADGYVFSGCVSLEKIEFGKAVTIVTDRMFSGCSALREVTVPDTVGEIGDYAFASCKGLTKLVIPASVEKIGVGIIDGSTSAVIYTYAGSEAESYALSNSLQYVIIEC